MNEFIESMSKVVSDEIENPTIDCECSGVTSKFSGDTAKIFALGIIVGYKFHVDGIQHTTLNPPHKED